MTAAASAFTEFDAVHARWREAVNEGTPRGALIDEVVDMAERIIAETDATGQGREWHLIRALADYAEASDFSNAEGDALGAADALVRAMTSVVNA